jgi:hypothetical protein
MEYFAGLDISMDETHICVLDREGEVVRESKTASMAQAIADELAKAPNCRPIVFETGRMAPILFRSSKATARFLQGVSTARHRGRELGPSDCMTPQARRSRCI